MAEFSLRWCYLAGMDLSGKSFDPPVRFLDVISQAGVWRQSGIAQPIVTNHAALISIRDRARLELPHFRKCLLGTCPHRLQKIIGKSHPTDVDRETDVVITQKILLEALPKRVHQLELTRICFRRKCGLWRDVETLNRSRLAAAHDLSWRHQHQSLRSRYELQPIRPKRKPAARRLNGVMRFVLGGPYSIPQ